MARVSNKRNKTSNKGFKGLIRLAILSFILCLLFGFNAGDYSYKGIIPTITSRVSENNVVTSSKQDGVGIYYQDGSQVPEYSGSQILTVNNDDPFFTKEEINDLNTKHYFSYGGQDVYGRATSAIATVSKDDLVSSETRKGIELPNPKGWVGRSKGGIYDRSHLIAYTLGGKNDLENLVTGTVSFNQKYMTQVEGDVRDYIKSSGHSVLYRVTPYYRGDELVPIGVLMEATDGSSFKRNRFVYNVQDGFTIDYKTGEVKEN